VFLSDIFNFLERPLTAAVNELPPRTYYRIVFTHALIFIYVGDRKSECASVWFIVAKTLSS